MPKTTEGKLIATGLRFGIVSSRWNGFLTDPMTAAAVETLLRHGVADHDIEIVKVPGSWEIPIAVQKLANGGRLHAVIAIGCLIRGATPHFDYLASDVTGQLGSIALSSGVPVTYGVITVENIEQGIERAGTKAGNKGAEAASAAIEMATLMHALEAGHAH
jgi:6,7-dimethyl-8-ribityllumazine synthase